MDLIRLEKLIREAKLKLALVYFSVGYTDKHVLEVSQRLDLY